MTVETDAKQKAFFMKEGSQFPINPF